MDARAASPWSRREARMPEACGRFPTVWLTSSPYCGTGIRPRDHRRRSHRLRRLSKGRSSTRRRDPSVAAQERLRHSILRGRLGESCRLLPPATTDRRPRKAMGSVFFTRVAGPENDDHTLRLERCFHCSVPIAFPGNNSVEIPLMTTPDHPPPAEPAARFKSLPPRPNACRAHSIPTRPRTDFGNSYGINFASPRDLPESSVMTSPPGRKFL